MLAHPPFAVNSCISLFFEGGNSHDGAGKLFSITKELPEKDRLPDKLLLLRPWKRLDKGLRAHRVPLPPLYPPKRGDTDRLECAGELRAFAGAVLPEARYRIIRIPGIEGTILHFENIDEESLRLLLRKRFSLCEAFLFIRNGFHAAMLRVPGGKTSLLRRNPLGTRDNAQPRKTEPHKTKTGYPSRSAGLFHDLRVKRAPFLYKQVNSRLRRGLEIGSDAADRDEVIQVAP